MIGYSIVVGAQGGAASTKNFPKIYGGPRASEMRTWMAVDLITGVPHGRWRGNPFLVWPFSAFVPELKIDLPSNDHAYCRQHPIFLALQWREILDSEQAITTAEIARSQGLTPARIRQILRLATLAPETISELRGLRDEDLRKLPETRLRCLVPLRPDDQIAKFEELKTQSGVKRNR